MPMRHMRHIAPWSRHERRGRNVSLYIQAELYFPLQPTYVSGARCSCDLCVPKITAQRVSTGHAYTWLAEAESAARRGAVPRELCELEVGVAAIGVATGATYDGVLGAA